MSKACFIHKKISLSRKTIDVCEALIYRLRTIAIPQDQVAQIWTKTGLHESRDFFIVMVGESKGHNSVTITLPQRLTLNSKSHS